MKQTKVLIDWLREEKCNGYKQYSRDVQLALILRNSLIDAIIKRLEGHDKLLEMFKEIILNNQDSFMKGGDL